MHTDTTPKEKPTGSANCPAGHTDRLIVWDIARRIKAALIRIAAWLALMLRGLA